MPTIESVRGAVTGECPICGNLPDNCAIRMTHELLKGFDLSGGLANDPHYPEFYEKFRNQVARAYENHLDRSAGDRNENNRCLQAALFDGEQRSAQALGAHWVREFTIEPTNQFRYFPKKRIDFKTTGVSRETYIELKGNFSFNDLGAAFLEAVLLTQSTERYEGPPVFYLMTLHCGYRQEQYKMAVRQVEALGRIARDLDVDLRYVNLLPFYHNDAEILEFLETIRG